jgi:hypothetical protein
MTIPLRRGHVTVSRRRTETDEDQDVITVPYYTPVTCDGA